jgi:hypothetical protein
MLYAVSNSVCGYIYTSQASRDKAVTDARQKQKLVNQSLAGKAAQQQVATTPLFL